MKVYLEDEHMIDGVAILELTQIIDARGRVMHMMRADHPMFKRFGEIYFSEVLPGIVKAWKRHKSTTQHLTAPLGSIQLVIFDDRENSRTKGVTKVLEINRENYRLVIIPPMLWYGFKCVGDEPALVANCTDIPHDKKESEVRDIKDPYFPYKW